MLAEAVGEVAAKAPVDGPIANPLHQRLAVTAVDPARAHPVVEAVAELAAKAPVDGPKPRPLHQRPAMTVVDPARGHLVVEAVEAAGRTVLPREPVEVKVLGQEAQGAAAVKVATVIVERGFTEPIARKGRSPGSPLDTHLL